MTCSAAASLGKQRQQTPLTSAFRQIASMIFQTSSPDVAADMLAA
eukprot:CAMPEP_0195339710 /NCGR_PEP_ID=MMETSP0708-20121125/18385_1 /TAXON_ID=33640 /ORGANISM="Asterionellopsis glacialis, Strain CCMP134" /LENGTH=44 /DNA_ID= /DNA_START= /DNA_END= /DNA_ORIENTATION=